jgi:transcriptional regulator GlxA family with amidase domain
MAGWFRLLTADVGSEEKNYVGVHLRVTPREWLQRERLTHAQSLMVSSDAPLAQIADTCGFCDVYHFSREFKRAVGNAIGNGRSLRIPAD